MHAIKVELDIQEGFAWVGRWRPPFQISWLLANEHPARCDIDPWELSSVRRGANEGHDARQATRCL